MLKYRITIEYEGTKYHGWQRQKKLYTVQDEIEKALFRLTKKHIIIYGASRTDAGVHAYGQIAHFETDQCYSANSIKNALNYYLKFQAISITNIALVDKIFHARFSKKVKRYFYRIINRKSPLTMQTNFAWHILPKINISNIIQASKYIIGTFDFTSFRASGCQSQSFIKTINYIEIIRDRHEIKLIFIAESFLYNQIRIMVGTLKNFGINSQLDPLYMKEIIDSKNRRIAGDTAPSCGLYLDQIYYY